MSRDIGLCENCLDGAFGHASLAINAVRRVNIDHLIVHVETLNRANRNAIGVATIMTRLGNNMRHGINSFRKAGREGKGRDSSQHNHPGQIHPDKYLLAIWADSVHNRRLARLGQFCQSNWYGPLKQLFIILAPPLGTEIPDFFRMDANMIKSRIQLLIAWFILCDLLVTSFAWAGSFILRFETDWIPQGGVPLNFEYVTRQIPWILLAALASYAFVGQYRANRMRKLRDEALFAVKGSFLLVLLLVAFDFFRKEFSSSRAMFLLFGILNTIALFVGRQLTWKLIRYYRSHGMDQSNSIIVGLGRVARKMAKTLEKNSWLGIKNLGFVENQRSRFSQDLSCLGSFEELPELIKKLNVEHVFIALPMNRYDDVRNVYSLLADSFVDVRLAADIPELAGLALSTSDVDGMPLVSLRENPHFGINVLFKRTLDIVLSLIGLILISPLFLLVAASIKWTSKGPIFYRQERCGLNGSVFQMLKFRSMQVDAEKETGAVWASKDDNRKTWLGAFLRKTSIDELPQLFNVLRGEMSLVGPRPERPVFIDQFKKHLPNYNVRHAVKAGITGWAQVNGWRGNTSLRKRLQFDLYYITHWSPWLDIRILWLTVFKGIIHRNAY